MSQGVGLGGESTSCLSGPHRPPCTSRVRPEGCLGMSTRGAGVIERAER